MNTFQNNLKKFLNNQKKIFQNNLTKFFLSLSLAHLVPCPEFFFFRVTMVTIAIMFHNHILILTLWASLLRC